MTDAPAPPLALDADAITAALRRMGLVAAEERPRCRPLEGGVSSDIWLVEAGARRLCVKRALPRLKVRQLWEAPVARNRYEWQWFEAVARILPEAVPPLLGQDDEANLFAMGYLEPQRYPLWKARLRDGHADPATAAAVGERLALIHRSTAGDAALARRFATDDGFYAIRLEPYLVATARAHPDVAPALEALARTTAATRTALVHGDVSPKNILVGPAGPVFLDAECAWYGDPAFDLAFCLNHLLLKCLWTPRAATGFLACFDRLAAAYLAGAAWEPRDALEARTARLLPGLFLARIDGKSPVEYVTEARQKDQVRRVARAFLADPPARLAEIRAAWAKEIGA
jgi:aminoglycoside phosphotransferase (APT) family kinase protein